MLNSIPRIKQSFLEFSPVLPKASLVAQTINNLPAMQETWVRSLGGEDPLEEDMATQLQCCCLENPMDRGAWWAAVHGVAKSRTGLSN